jgi:type II secretory pathway pseudopilin PulG
MPSPRTRRRQSGFTIHELLVVIVLVMVVVAFNVPVDAAARRTARRMQNSTQLRGIHQGLVTFANSNKNIFPGLNSKGEIIANGKDTTGNSGDGDTVQARFWIMLDGDFFTPEYAISPSEVADVDEVEWGGNVGTGTVFWNADKKNYSYAMLGIKGVAGEAPDAKFAARAAEWRQTLNMQAIALSDRNVGDNATNQVQSIHSDRGGWQGSVLWNDNHVGFENEQYFETKYANGQLNFNPPDNLFDDKQAHERPIGANALMVITGDDTVHGGE